MLRAEPLNLDTIQQNLFESIELSLPNVGVLDAKVEMPDGYIGPILHGAKCFSYKTATIELVLQEFTGDQYGFRFGMGKFLKDALAKNAICNEGLYCYFMLKGNARTKTSSLGRMHLRQDQYSAHYFKSDFLTADFEKNSAFRLLDIFYSPKLLAEFSPYFPEVASLINGGQDILSRRPCRVLPSMKEVTQQILNCPYENETRKFYFDLKVRELLFQVLRDAFRERKAALHFSPWEKSRILEARNILERHISQKTPSIKSLARQVAMNEFKLKAGFRQFFQSGIFEWLMERKLHHAKELLQTTNKPVKEICALVGYPRTPNFITAFRKRFGVTPGSFRRE